MHCEKGLGRERGSTNVWEGGKLIWNKCRADGFQAGSRNKGSRSRSVGKKRGVKPDHRKKKRKVTNKHSGGSNLKNKLYWTLD